MTSSVVRRMPYQFRPYRNALMKSFLLPSTLPLFVILYLLPTGLFTLHALIALGSAWRAARQIRPLKSGQFVHASDGRVIGAACGHCVDILVVLSLA